MYRKMLKRKLADPNVAAQKAILQGSGLARSK